jgi:hypothetical protein
MRLRPITSLCCPTVTMGSTYVVCARNNKSTNKRGLADTQARKQLVPATLEPRIPVATTLGNMGVCCKPWRYSPATSGRVALLKEAIIAVIEAPPNQLMSVTRVGADAAV